ncbi:MAG TPA: EAL domain-containing protein [Actinocrinis sp.]|nr:EAL domain-containing protein [Actinocrinis sp.]
MDRRFVSGFLGAIALGAAAYYAAPQWRAESWALIGLCAVAAMCVGIARNRPALRAPWYLMLAALSTFVVTDAVENVLGEYYNHVDTFPTISDDLSLLAYPLATAAFLLLIHRQYSGHDWVGLLDALTLTAGLALLAWIYLISPAVDSHNRSLPARTIAIAYPLGDVLLLVVLARLLSGSSTRPVSMWLLTIGAVGLLTSDVFFELGELHHGWQPGDGTEAGWISFYICWGLAGLHESMSQVATPRKPGFAEIPAVGLALLAVASLTAPVVLLVESVRQHVRQTSVIAVFSAISFLLVLTRLMLVLRNYRHAMDRERALQITGAAMVAAVTLEEIGEAVEKVGTMLFPPDSASKAVLVDAAALPRLAAALPTLAVGQPIRCDQLPREVAARFGALPTALVFPLGVRREAGAGQMADGEAAALPDPVLIVAGAAAELGALHDTLEILGRQATLATARVLLNQEIRRRHNEAYFRTLVHNATDVIMIVDDDARIRYASPSADLMFLGLNLTGQSLNDLVDRRHAGLVRAVLAGTEPGPVDWSMLRTDGTAISVEVRSDDLRDDETVAGLALTLRDVTEQRRLEGELTHYAYHDPLTGLANRRRVQDRIDQAIVRAEANGQIAYLLLLDLDDFKDVNDTKGHGVGDDLLVAVAERLGAGLRPGDLAARLGGDEFTVLLQNVARAQDVEALAERLTRAFDRPFVLSENSVVTGASIGIATTVESHSAEELLRNADLALYAAKADGKRRWRRYEPGLHDTAVERTVLRESLARAITDQTITLHYQPVVELGDGRVSGFEALARWPHAVRGMINPDQFIPLAEETGQILPLGRLLLRQAVTDAAAWNQGGARTPPLTIAVNVSIQQFRDPGFADEVIALLEAAGLPPELLVLELTESELMRQHDDQARKTLTMFKDRRVRIAIDDFGTGYSSLSYLRDLPIDLLKIDKSFIANITSSPEQAALVEGIIRIADALELYVVAEGVETQAQWDLLGSTDCAYGQGYLFSRPMPADWIGELLREHPDPRLPLTAEEVS